MSELAMTGNVKSVTDPHRPKDFLDPTEIKAFLEAAKNGRNGTRGSPALLDDVPPWAALQRGG
jgi:hypothetical protein